MAMSAQDLFYDYKVAKYVIEEKRLGGGVKYCIVGLAYFSMEYDYSKSCAADQIIRYYPEISDSHNMMDSEFFPIFAEREIKRITQQYSYLASVFEMRGSACKLIDEEGRKQAEMDFNKHYPVTIFENQCILNNYLSFLENHKIKPIIVIMPAHSCYTKYIPLEKKELFHRVLDEVLSMHNVQVLNYLDSYECPETHYYHVSHFNETGASEFTKRLIHDIEW